MPYIAHTATFDPAAAPVGIPEDLACPACGCTEQCDLETALSGHELRFFCDSCGAFVTVSFNDEQAEALRRWQRTHGRAQIR